MTMKLKLPHQIAINLGLLFRVVSVNCIFFLKIATGGHCCSFVVPIPDLLVSLPMERTLIWDALGTEQFGDSTANQGAGRSTCRQWAQSKISVSYLTFLHKSCIATV